MKDSTKQKFQHIQWKIKNTCWRVENFVRDKGGALVDWVIEHPTETVGIVSLGVSGLKASQSLVVSHRTNKERDRIDRTYYDPSTGFHWSLRRKPTNQDRIEISKRKCAGEDVGKILTDLRLI